MITLFGATGYTGQRVARALDRAGLAFRLAGRSPDKLAALSAALNSRPTTLVADAQAQSSLAALFEGARLLVNCVGPFTDLGEPLAAAAAARGTHYLDIANELAYVYRLRQYDRLARQTGAALVPACGFEVALSDCAAALLARGLGQPLDEIVIVYAVKDARLSLGTRLSALRILATSWFAYRGGRLVGQAPGGGLRHGTINGRPYSAIAFPSAETITLPTHCAVQEVSVWLAAARASAGLLSWMAPLAGWLLRTPLGWPAAEVVKRLGPPPADSTQARFAIKLEARRGQASRSQVWSGRDPYGLTAEIVAHAARLLTSADYQRCGVLAPAQALDPEAFLQWLIERREVIVNEGG